jgi:hypothetical protein
MDDVLAVAEVEGVGDGEHDLGYLAFVGTAMQVVL